MSLSVVRVCVKILSLTVEEAKNSSHPSKFKGLGPFIFLRENRNVFKFA